MSHNDEAEDGFTGICWCLLFCVLMSHEDEREDGFAEREDGFSRIFVGLLMLLLFLFEFYGFDFTGFKFAGEISLIFPSSNFMRLNCSSCSLRLLFLSCFVFNFCLIL